ncbi:MAG: IncP-type conjugal transfer protein TraG [Pseudomonadota bacterium]
MKLTTTIFWQVLLVLCIVICGVWFAAQWTAAQLAYSTRLGEPCFILGGTPIYAPWRFFGWWYSYEAYAPSVFHRAGLIAGGSGVAGLFAAIVGAVLRSRESKNVTTYGSSRWAKRSEIKLAGLLTTDGVFLGQIKNAYLRHDGPEHVMAFAPTRSGKGVGLVIPTLLSWQHSAVIHDIKGENWDLTSGWRSGFSRVVRFDPTHPQTLCFNPLLEVRKGRNEVRDVQNIADILVDPEGGLDRRNHWDKTAHSLLVGAILHVLYAETDKSLAGVAHLLSHPSRSFEDTLDVMLRTNHLGTDTEPKVHPAVAQSARELLNKSENERSGVLSTALSFLSLYRDPTVARATSSCDFRISDLVDGEQPLSLYLVVPPSDISRTRPLVRLILNQIGRRLTEAHETTTSERRQVLLMLDEFPALGRLDFFETALGYMAGYGLRAFLIAQSLNQISKAYGADNSILDNCHVRVAFASNDERTAKRISDALGSTTELRAMKNYAGHRLAPWLSHVMVSRQETARQLLTPGEVMQLPADDEIVMVAGAPPVRAKKLRYYKDRNFIGRVLPAIAPGQSFAGEAVVLPGTAWDDCIAEIHDALIIDPDDHGGLQHSPKLERDPNQAPDLKSDGSPDLDESEVGEPIQRDFFGAPVAEADAFDELTTTRLFQGRGR